MNNRAWEPSPPSPFPEDPRVLMQAREFDKFWKASELRRRSEQIQQAAYPAYKPNPYTDGISRVKGNDHVPRIISLVKLSQPCYGALPTQPTVRYQFAPSPTLSPRHRSSSDQRTTGKHRSSSAPQAKNKKTARLPWIPNYPMERRRVTRRPPQWNDVLPRQQPKGVLVLGPLYRQQRSSYGTLPRI